MTDGAPPRAPSALRHSRRRPGPNAPAATAPVHASPRPERFGLPALRQSPPRPALLAPFARVGARSWRGPLASSPRVALRARRDRSTALSCGTATHQEHRVGVAREQLQHSLDGRVDVYLRQRPVRSFPQYGRRQPRVSRRELIPRNMATTSKKKGQTWPPAPKCRRNSKGMKTGARFPIGHTG